LDPEDWGMLLLYDKFPMMVQEGEQIYHIYLFETVILCCKEVPKDVKRQSKAKNMPTYEIKGKIFATSISDVLDISNIDKQIFELKVFWNEAEESFILKCRNIEQVRLWQERIIKCAQGLAHTLTVTNNDAKKRTLSVHTNSLSGRRGSVETQFRTTKSMPAGAGMRKSTRAGNELPPRGLSIFANQGKNGSVPRNRLSSNGSIDVSLVRDVAPLNGERQSQHTKGGSIGHEKGLNSISSLSAALPSPPPTAALPKPPSVSLPPPSGPKSALSEPPRSALPQPPKSASALSEPPRSALPSPPISSTLPPPPISSLPTPPTKKPVPINPRGNSLPQNISSSTSRPRGGNSLIKMKTHYGNDIFILAVASSGCKFEEILEKIERKIRICGAVMPEGRRIKLRYRDEDEDLITINTDDDVEMAFEIARRTHEKGTVTIIVE
jgi:cell division control protein 24